MFRVYHNHAIKLNDNLLKYVSKNIANEIAFGVELSLDPTKEQILNWINHMSKELESRFNDDEIKLIRMGCYCNDGGNLDAAKKMIKNVYDASSSFSDFVAKMNEHDAGWYINNDSLYTKYNHCSCKLLKDIELLPSKTWCYCTVGFNKALFEYVLNEEVDIELLESIKLGDKQCLMRVDLINKTFDDLWR